MRKSIHFFRFLWKPRLTIVTSCIVLALALIQSMCAQTTYTAITNGDISALTTWSATSSIIIPTASTSPIDENTWSTGLFRLGVTMNPYTFYGGTLNIADNGVLSLNSSSAVLNLNNLTLNGGILQASTTATATVNLQGKTFLLNSGSLKTTSNNSVYKNLLFDNCSLAGNGTITIGQIQSGAYECIVEFLNSVNTNGFKGKFEVVPGLSGTAAGGTLKLNALKIADASFGVNVFADSASTSGVVSNGTTYSSSVHGKLYFTPGVGNTLALVSLTLGGMDITPGTYGLTAGTGITAFTATQQTFLNPASTGTVTVTGAVYPPTNVVGGALVYFTNNENNAGYAVTSYTVTPYDVTTSTYKTPVAGAASPISVSGLTLNHSYTFTVKATNIVGVTSIASTPSAPVTITAPGAPIIGKAYTSGISGTAYVAFIAPLSNGNSPITSYVVTSNPAKGSGTFTDKVGSGIITVTGLSNNTAYTFTVKAKNAFGTSAASAASNSVTVDPTTFPTPPKIITVSDPTTTTHQLTSGNFTIGVTNLGGGVINQVLIPDIGDIMGVEAKKYGRSGQAAIRDRAHGGVYNPTQAGFNETLGTPCQLDQTTGKIVVQPHGVALWYGDGNYDFTRWENIGADPYTEATFFGGAANASDMDGLDEENVAVDINGSIYTKQEAEVYSEWDYYGTYEDYMGKAGIATPAIRHYNEFRFIRPPGHCINQFKEGSPLWSPNALRSNIAHANPVGAYPGTDKDMNTMLSGWAIRHDRIKWTPKYSFFRNKNKSWEVTLADSSDLAPNNDGSAFIISDSNNPTMGHALGLYRPKTEINLYPVVGVNEKTEAIVYKDDRQVFSSDSFRITKSMFRIPTMSLYGFGGQISGMINRIRLDPDVYETLRAEYFIFYGTPNQIMTAVAAYDSSTLVTGMTEIIKENKYNFQIQSDESSKSFVVKLNDVQEATLRIFNPMGKLLYSTTTKTDTFTIHKDKILSKGVIFVEVNGVTKKIILL